MRGDSSSSNGYGGGGNVPQPPVDGPPSYVPKPEPEGLTLRDIIAAMWRRKWIILGVVVVATASAYYFAYRQPRQYEAKASLIYEQGLDLANPLTGQGAINPAAVDREIAGISDVMTSPDIRALSLIHISEPTRLGMISY